MGGEVGGDAGEVLRDYGGEGLEGGPGFWGFWSVLSFDGGKKENVLGEDIICGGEKWKKGVF